MADQATTAGAAPPPLPRVAIQFCTQCKWMLRAAYYAQELLSTFSTSLGEVALQPSTGGTFIVTISQQQQQEALPGRTEGGGDGTAASAVVVSKVLWDRKTDGGFPETKELKRRVRDVIDPGRGLGHVDRDYGKEKKQEGEKQKEDGGVEGEVQQQQGERVEIEREEQQQQQVKESGGEKGEECEDCKP